MGTYEVSLDCLPVPALAVDAQGVVVYLNPAARAELDLPPGAMTPALHVGAILDALDTDPWIMPERPRTFRTFFHVGTKLDREVTVTVSPLGGAPGRWLVVIVPLESARPTGTVAEARPASVGSGRKATAEAVWKGKAPEAALPTDTVEALLAARSEAELTRQASLLLERIAGISTARLFLYDEKAAELNLVPLPGDMESPMASAAHLPVRKEGTSLSERAFTEGRMAEGEEEALHFDDPATGTPLRVSAVLPLVWEKQTLGTLALLTVDVRTYTERERRLLRSAARYAAGGLARLGRERRMERALGELARREAELTAALRIGRLALDAMNIDDTANVLADALIAAYQLDWFLLAVDEPDGRLVVHRCAERMPDRGWVELADDAGAELPESLVEAPASAGRTIDALPAAFRPTTHGPWAFAVRPLQASGGRMGVIAVGSRTSDDDAFQTQLVMLPALLDQAAAVCAHVRNCVGLRDVHVAKGETIAAVAHDLRGPVTATLGFTDTLLSSMRLQLSACARELVEVIRDQARQVVNQVVDLVELSQVDVGPIVLHRKWERFGDVIDEATTAAAPDIARAAVRLRADIPDEVKDATVWVDRVRAVQALYGLLESVMWSVRGGEIFLTALLERTTVRMIIAGTGGGADSEGRQTAQEGLPPPYRHAGRAALDLSIARYLATLHGGHVGVESGPGIGNRLWLTLPRIRRLHSNERAGSLRRDEA